MATLHIECEIVNETDYDDNPITYKRCKSTIDGKPTELNCVCGTEYTDEQIKQGHRAKLAERGFTWDNEE